MNLLDYSQSAWSLLPPLLALSLAILTRRVLFSLALGIIAGALLLNVASPVDALIYTGGKVISLIYDDGLNDNLYIILFLLLLGVLTSLLSLSGSNQAFANWAKRRIRSRRGAKLLTASLVFVTFIDDYFHSLAVGAIARPVTDKFQISRAKLAYILDSTAAPMCVLTPISSWGAYVIALVASLLATHQITGYSPMGAFLTISAMNFYAIFSLILVFVVAYFSIDLASMARFERQAQQHNPPHSENVHHGSVSGLIFPIISLILGTIAMMIATGLYALKDDGKTLSILGAFENTNVGVSLLVGALLSLSVATLFIHNAGTISFKDYVSSSLLGMRSMMGAIAILCFAWTINGVVSDINTGKYLSTIVAGNLDIAFMPALLFLLSATMAFSTGTSWGTFGIMLPIAASMAVNTDPQMILPCLAAVMAGAVAGDHCSPISDTTILSSTGAECNHIDHVRSQFPYALLVIFASFAGYLALGITQSMLFGFITTTAIFILCIFLFSRNNEAVAKSENIMAL